MKYPHYGGFYQQGYLNLSHKLRNLKSNSNHSLSKISQLSFIFRVTFPHVSKSKFRYSKFFQGRGTADSKKSSKGDDYLKSLITLNWIFWKLRFPFLHDSCHMWLVTTLLDNMDKECSHHHRKFDLTALD